MLQNKRVPSKNDRDDATHGLPEWKIPWHDAEDRAERQERDISGLTFDLSEFVIEQWSTAGGRPFTQVGAFFDFGLRLRDRFSHFASHGDRKFVNMRAQNVGELAEEDCPVDRLYIAPYLECRDGFVQQALNLVLILVGIAGEHFAGGGINCRRLVWGYFRSSHLCSPY